MSATLARPLTSPGRALLSKYKMVSQSKLKAECRVLSGAEEWGIVDMLDSRQGQVDGGNV